MIPRRKSKWEFNENFDPVEAGWVFNPRLSLMRFIEELLTEFDKECPKPGHLQEFVLGLCIDPIGYWQLLEELAKERLFIDRRRLYEEGMYGDFPIFLSGVSGTVSLALSTSLAPSLLRQQIGRVDPLETKSESAEEKTPDKEDMH